MDFEQELKRIAGQYEGMGYTVTIRPKPEDLPPFARDFKVELLARRGDTASLVSVRRNLQEVSADQNMSRYAEITNAQPGWRFDFVILEGENAMERDIRGAPELSDQDIRKVLEEAEQLCSMGFVRPAVLTAWSGLEAAMRTWLRASGEQAGWGSLPRPMLNELYSSGAFSATEFPQLERLYQLRSEIVHGFGSANFDAGSVQFLTNLARRLLADSQSAKQTA